MTDQWIDTIRDVAHDAVFKANSRLQRKLEDAFADSPEVEVRAVKLKTQPDDKVLSRAFLRVKRGASKDEAILFNLRISDNPRDRIYPAGSPNYRGSGKGVNKDAKVLRFDDGEFRPSARWPDSYDVTIVERCVREWIGDVQRELNRL